MPRPTLRLTFLGNGDNSLMDSELDEKALINNAIAGVLVGRKARRIKSISLTR